MYVIVRFLSNYHSPASRGTVAPSHAVALMKTLLCTLLVVMSGVASRAANFCQWDFNGNLASSTGGANLTADAATPATAAGVTFTTATIGGQTAQVAAFTRGTFFRMTHGLAANGGGSYVNQYTLIMDVMFPSRPTGWAVLWQTNPDDSNDGDWFINSSGGLGISGVYGGSVADGTWNRIALVVDGVAGTFTSYLNGTSVQQISGAGLDGRWSLDTTALLFADEDGENAGGYVNSVQLRGSALAAAEIAALGGPQAAGIPVPQTSSGLRLVSPNGGEVLQAGTSQSVTWEVSNPGGLVQVDLLLGETVYRALGQALMRQSNYLWNIDPQLGDTNTYRIRLTSLDFPSVQDFSDAAFSITGSGVPPNPAFGQPLQVNGGFESLLTNWQVIAGNPTTLTSTGGEGAPYAGSRFLYGGRNAGGDMVVRQDIDLLAAGFTASESGWRRGGGRGGEVAERLRRGHIRRPGLFARGLPRRGWARSWRAFAAWCPATTSGCSGRWAGCCRRARANCASKSWASIAGTRTTTAWLTK